MRWVALGVDYEMAGKDLIDWVELSGEIARALGAQPPEGFNYELFLDEQGQKISKSRGNGLTIEEWLRYASPESLSLFMYREPKAAKRLYFDVIPRHVDEDQPISRWLRAPGRQAAALQSGLAHPLGLAANADMPISFSMLLTLVSSSERRERRHAVGVHRPLPAGRDARDPSQARSAGRVRHRFATSCCRPSSSASRRQPSAASAYGPARRALAASDRRHGRANPGCGLRDRPPRAVPRPEEKAKDGKPGVSLAWFDMLYQVLLGQEKGRVSVLSWRFTACRTPSI